MLASLTRKHMHALQQTNRRKKEIDHDHDVDEVTDKRSPSSPGI